MQITHKRSFCRSGFASDGFTPWAHEQLNNDLEAKIEEYKRTHPNDKFINYKYSEINYPVGDRIMYKRTVTFEKYIRNLILSNNLINVKIVVLN